MKNNHLNKEKNKINIFTILVVMIVISTIIICVIMYISNLNKVKNNRINKYDNFDILDVKVYENANPIDKPSISGIENIKYENGIKINVSEKINKDIIVGDYSFKNISLKSDSNGTSFSTNITYISKKETSEKYININFYDNNNKFVSTLSGYIPKLELGQSVDVVYKSISDLANAYDMEIILK